jgi:hypothetical protein
MLSVLIAIRDFLVAMTLAWFGITVQSQHAQSDMSGCTGQACQTQTAQH